VGMVVLTYIHDKHTLFTILLFCMIGAYSFQRKNYVVSVLFMTPYILILFDFLGMGGLSIARERIYDTLIGSGIALIASYVLFPNWEHEKLKDAMIDTLKANLAYYEQVTLLYFEKSENLTNYKVARKEVYVTSANLASLFQRMFSEPKSKQFLMAEIHQFTALNHLLSSYIATLSLYYKEHTLTYTSFDDLKPMATNTLYLLNLSSENLFTQKPPNNVPLIRIKSDHQLDEDTIKEQFDMIQKVAYDIYKLTEKIKF
jgi:uncharacterized membrane protein YccC